MKSHSSENDLVLKVLDKSYIKQIMNLQSEIVKHIGNPELFAVSKQEEFEEAIEEKGCILGYVTADHQLIAMGSYLNFGYDERNYGMILI